MSARKAKMVQVDLPGVSTEQAVYREPLDLDSLRLDLSKYEVGTSLRPGWLVVDCPECGQRGEATQPRPGTTQRPRVVHSYKLSRSGASVLASRTCRSWDASINVALKTALRKAVRT